MTRAIALSPAATWWEGLVLEDNPGSRTAPHPSIRKSELDAFAARVREARSLAAGVAHAVDAEPAANDRVPPDAAVLIEELNVAEEELHSQYDEILASRALVESEQARYLELFELAPDAYVVTDVAGAIIEANRATGRLLGVRTDKLPHKPLTAFVAETERRGFRERLGRLPADGGRATIAVVMRTRQGGLVDVEATVAPILRGGSCTGYRWLLRDVTVQRTAERENARLRARLEEMVAERTADLQRALEEVQTAYGVAEQESTRKSDFLAFLSHEVRTPMQAIVGYSDMFAMELHGPLTAAQREDLARMQRGQQHILRLLDQLLDYARIDSGHADLQTSVVSLDALCESALELVRPQAAVAGIEVACTGERVLVRADAEKVRQILINLVSNAVKFGPRPGVVRLHATRAGDFGVLTVEDEGPGIAPELAEGIFEPFVHHGPTTPGIGLGLPISRRLARAMGGDLLLDQSAIATRFELRLPAV